MKAARNIGSLPYYVICAVAVAAIYLIELNRGSHLVNYLIPLVGFLAVFSRWSQGPLMLLLTLGGAETAKAFMGIRMQPAGSWGFRGEDALLCVAVLAFTVAHYRLLGLIVNVLPPDPRRQGDSQDTQRPPPLARSPHLADPVEVGILLLTLPVWAILGHLAWAILSLPWEVAGMPARLVRLILLAWAVGIGLFVTSALLGLWKRRQHSAAEATLFLQDTLWRETRGDQRRLQRWLAWERLRRTGEGH